MRRIPAFLLLLAAVVPAWTVQAADEVKAPKTAGNFEVEVRKNKAGP
jgi:hypothetical protein